MRKSVARYRCCFVQKGGGSHVAQMGRNILCDCLGCRRIRFLRYCGRCGKHCQDPFLPLFGHLRRLAHRRISRRPKSGFLGEGLKIERAQQASPGSTACRDKLSAAGQAVLQSLPTPCNRAYAALRPDFRPRVLAVPAGFATLVLLSTLRFKSAIKSMTSPFAGRSSSSSEGSVITSVCPD